MSKVSELILLELNKAEKVALTGINKFRNASGQKQIQKISTHNSEKILRDPSNSHKPSSISFMPSASTLATKVKNFFSNKKVLSPQERQVIKDRHNIPTAAQDKARTLALHGGKQHPSVGTNRNVIQRVFNRLKDKPGFKPKESTINATKHYNAITRIQNSVLHPIMDKPIVTAAGLIPGVGMAAQQATYASTLAAAKATAAAKRAINRNHGVINTSHALKQIKNSEEFKKNLHHQDKRNINLISTADPERIPHMQRDQQDDIKWKGNPHLHVTKVKLAEVIPKKRFTEIVSKYHKSFKDHIDTTSQDNQPFYKKYPSKVVKKVLPVTKKVTDGAENLGSKKTNVVTKGLHLIDKYGGHIIHHMDAPWVNAYNNAVRNRHVRLGREYHDAKDTVQKLRNDTDAEKFERIGASLARTGIYRGQ